MFYVDFSYPTVHEGIIPAWRKGGTPAVWRSGAAWVVNPRPTLKHSITTAFPERVYMKIADSGAETQTHASLPFTGKCLWDKREQDAHCEQTAWRARVRLCVQNESLSHRKTSNVAQSRAPVGSSRLTAAFSAGDELRSHTKHVPLLSDTTWIRRFGL